MDTGLIQSIAVGIASGLCSAALLPMLFKGRLRFDREYVAQAVYYEKRIAEHAADCEEKMITAKERHVEIVTLKDKEIGNLQDGLDDTEKELRSQYVVVADLTKQVIATINFLQSLTGLAATERRGKRGSEQT